MQDKGVLMAEEAQNPDEQNPDSLNPSGVPGEPADGAEQLAPPVNQNFKWYIIHAYSGFERKVKRVTRRAACVRIGLEDRVGRIDDSRPSHVKETAQRQAAYIVDRVFLPGYVSSLKWRSTTIFGMW